MAQCVKLLKPRYFVSLCRWGWQLACSNLLLSTDATSLRCTWQLSVPTERGTKTATKFGGVLPVLYFKVSDLYSDKPKKRAAVMCCNADISSICLLTILSNLDLWSSNYWKQVAGRTAALFVEPLPPPTFWLIPWKTNGWKTTVSCWEDICIYKVQLLVSGWWPLFFGGKRYAPTKFLLTWNLKGCVPGFFVDFFYKASLLGFSNSFSRSFLWTLKNIRLFRVGDCTTQLCVCVGFHKPM